MIIPFFLATLLAAHTPEEGIRRVEAHLLIQDPPSALLEAKELSMQFPESAPVQKILVEAYAANGLETEALQLWNLLALKDPSLLYERHLLEELSWGVLKKGIQSTQYGVRLAALIGAYLTRDVRAVEFLRKMMRDSNAVLRSVAIQMSTAFRDAPLKEEITRLLQEEKVWMVKMEAIKAVGALKMKEFTPFLKALVQSEKTLLEERQVAIQALLEMYEEISLDELKTLALSARAGLRHLAAMVAAHFPIDGAKEIVEKLIHDTHPQVRIAALSAFGLLYRTKDLAAIQTSLADNDPTVAITAAWAAFLIDPKVGEEHLSKWLYDTLPENRRLAASALSAVGGRGVALSKDVMQKSQDPYVKANVALGLLGQRKELQMAADFLIDFLSQEKRMWMMDKRQNPLFETLAPSQIRYNDQIPNYPEAQDQMTRLHIVSLLALIEEPRALDALKTFLQRKSWGISGVAAATLLHEGDETALEMVKELIRDKDANVRLQACLVLAMFGKDDSVLRDLEGAYAGADHEKKFHILEALGRIGNSTSYSFLIGVLKEPFPILRVAAAAALIQSMNR